jgi:hypothetical protein
MQLGIQGTVDLSENATREAIVEMSLELVEGAGFDGVHLDVETVRSGDENYLLLLDEVREALGEQGIVSVAGSYWIPEVINQLPGIEGFKWDGEYYRAVAGRVDQIAVMTYDSVMPHPILYRLWLREQVRGIERSLDAANVELLFGLSVSREETFTHRPNAEDMQNGLAGICAGSAGGEAARGADGVAIYAAWEADTEDWAIWESWTSSLE